MNTVVRTCIGCRERVDATVLVRFVAVRESATTVVTLDLRHSLPGRGAHLHPTDRCLELATRRKAWGRALRVEGPLDLSRVTQHIASTTKERPAFPDPKSEHPLMDHR